MSLIKILNNNDINAFENPPEFNGEERKRFFYLPNWADKLVWSFRTPTNQVGFILQFGYFKATGRFFSAQKFRQNDIAFIARRLNIHSSMIALFQYNRTTFERHQSLILSNMGIQKFDASGKIVLQKKLNIYVRVK